MILINAGLLTVGYFFINFPQGKGNVINDLVQDSISWIDLTGISVGGLSSQQMQTIPFSR
jgi:hypothetical protein